MSALIFSLLLGISVDPLDFDTVDIGLVSNREARIRTALEFRQRIALRQILPGDRVLDMMSGIVIRDDPLRCQVALLTDQTLPSLSVCWE